MTLDAFAKVAVEIINHIKTLALWVGNNVQIILQWLDDNAGGIQAIATIVLVVITWRYVLLTNRLANAADTQAQLKKESLNARRRELLGYVTRLQWVLKALTLDRSDTDAGS